MKRIYLIIFTALLALTVSNAYSQNFDFEKMNEQAREYTVIVDMKIKFSFGVHTTEQDGRFLGTIVTSDGMVLYNGTATSSAILGNAISGMNIKSDPVSIKIITLDGTEYNAEYIGTDEETSIGFVKITDTNTVFKPIKFVNDYKFKTGEWLSAYMLLPDYVTPPFATDLGMVTTLIEKPEFFPLVVGFSPMQLHAVVFTEKNQAVGVVGLLNNPSQDSYDPDNFLENQSDFGIPMLGVITTDRVNKLIENPPVKGQTDKGWLGITLQALTKEMIAFWKLDISGGIIVNEVMPNSPADVAGLMVGDIIYEVNGQPVEVDKEEKISIFQKKISDFGPDVSIELSVIRKNDEGYENLKLLPTLGNTPLASVDAPEYENKDLEFTVRDLVFQDYLNYNLDEQTFNGVYVSELKQGGLAELDGLQIGDVIQRIGNEPVAGVSDVEAIMTGLEETKPPEIIFFVWRNQKTLFVNIKTDW